jgi:transcriptional regulator with XRE-family HTH domain
MWGESAEWPKKKRRRLQSQSPSAFLDALYGDPLCAETMRTAQPRHCISTPTMITSAQSRGARGILDWTQERLAKEAGVSLSTVKDFEAGRRTPIGNNLIACGALLRTAESNLSRKMAAGRALGSAKLLPQAPPSLSPLGTLARATEYADANFAQGFTSASPLNSAFERRGRNPPDALIL